MNYRRENFEIVPSKAGFTVHLVNGKDRRALMRFNRKFDAAIYINNLINKKY